MSKSATFVISPIANLYHRTEPLYHRTEPWELQVGVVGGRCGGRQQTALEALLDVSAIFQFLRFAFRYSSPSFGGAYWAKVGHKRELGTK
jgi:hypothetical protein